MTLNASYKLFWLRVSKRSISIIIPTLVVLLMFFQSSFANAPMDNPELAGRGYYSAISGFNSTIDVVQTINPYVRYAYIGEGSGMVILDVTNTEFVDRLSRVNLLELPEDIVVVDDMVYVADGWGGLFIIDASDVNAPEIVGNWSNGYPLFEAQMADDGVTLYLAAGESGLIVLDVSDPANPVLIERHDTPGVVRGLHIVGDRAYLADHEDGLRILDITDIDAIQELGMLDTDGQTTGVRIDADRAYLADGGNGLVIADISDPIDPQQLLRVDTNYDPSNLNTGDSVRLQVVGYDVFLADSGRGLHRIDVDPESDTYGQIVANMPNATVDVEVIGSSVFGACGNEVFFNSYNLGDPESRYATGQGYSVSKDGDLVILSAGYGGVFFINASDPQNLTYYSCFEDRVGPSNDTDVDGIRAFVGLGFEGLTEDYEMGIGVVDISNPNYPVRLVGERYFSKPYPVNALKAADGYIYAAMGEGGLHVVRYSSLPYVKTGDYNTPGYAFDVSLSDDHNTAYLADGVGGLQILDVSDKSNPEPLGNLDAGDAKGIQVVGNTAFVAADMGGLYIIDISDPAQPVELSNLTFGISVYNVTVQDNLAFLACCNDGIQVVNISDLSNPVTTARWETPGWANDVLGEGNLRYVADSWGGLQVLNPVSASGEIEPAGGEIQASDGSVTVVFPPDAVTEPITVTYHALYAPNQALPEGSDMPVISFNLEAETAGGQAVTTFSQPLTLTIHYLQSLLTERGLDERDLRIMYWSSSNTQWEQVFPCEGCTQDTQNDTITVLLDHFSEFALLTFPHDYVHLPYLGIAP